MNNKTKLHYCFTLITLLMGLYSIAANRYWVGNGSDKNWNNSANWSATSGGSGGASVPGTSDSVYFNGGGTGQLILDINVAILKLTMESSYTDTIKQNGKTVTLTNGGMVLKGGTFLGSTTNISVTGPFTLAGTKFISTSAMMLISGDYSFTGGSFDHNSGTIHFYGPPGTSTRTINGSTNFYNLLLAASGGVTYVFDASSVFNVAHMLTQSGGATIKINTGTINVQGDITISGTAYNPVATGTININGSGDQTVYGATGTNSLNQAGFCNVKINKTNGVLYLRNIINVAGTWEHILGVVDDTTYDAEMSFNTGGTNIIKGTQTFNKLWIGTYGGGSNTFKVFTGDTLTVGWVHTGVSGSIIYEGYINVTGDFWLGSSSTAGGGNGTITFNGTGNQLLTGQTLTATQGVLCNIKIDKPSGTLKLKNIISVKGNWNYIRGDVDAKTEASNVFFVSGSRTVSGKHKLNYLTFYSQASATYTIPTTDTITVEGLFRIAGAGSIDINGGTINAKAGILSENSGISGGGSGTINICGDGYQELTGNSTVSAGKLCNVAINKTGTLRLKKTISVVGNWIRNSGTLDALTDTSCVAFCGGNRNIVGKDKFYIICFYAVGASTNTIPETDTVTVLNNLVFAGNSRLNINTGTIKAKGNIYISNNFTTNNGNGWIHICGEGNQNVYGHTYADLRSGSLCNINIDKPSGTLYLSNKITLVTSSTNYYYWKYTRGTVNAGNSTVTMNGNYGSLLSVNGSNSMVFNNVIFLSGTPGLGTDLTLSGMLTLNGTLNTNGYTIKIGGNFYNDGTFNHTGSTVIFNGTTNQYITGTKPTLFNNLTVNKQSAKLYLNYPTTIASSLALVNGIIASSSTNYLHLNDNATSTAGSNSSFVAGPLRKTGNDAFTFPLGDTTLPDTSAYHPFSITAPSSTADSYTAQYYAKNQLTDHPTFTALQSSLKSISTCEYWSLTRNIGTSVVLPTLNWNKNSCNTGLPAELRVGGWDGSQWKNMGQASLTGTASVGSITAVSPGINAITQYYTLGLVPHLMTFNTQGLDSLSLPDTLKYTITGAGLTGTYVVGGIQNLYPNLPATGTVSLLIIHLSTNSGQSVDIGIELTPSGTTQNPHVIVPIGGPLQPSCNIKCLDLGTVIKINECILKNCFKLSSTVYAVLKRELDGGYFQIINGDFRFKFDEEYNKNAGKLSYRLYTDAHKLLLNTQSLPTGSQYNSAYGSNYFSINLQGCYDNSPLSAGYYVIEVENEKREVWTARLEYIPQGPQPACQSGGGGGIEQ